MADRDLSDVNRAGIGDFPNTTAVKRRKNKCPQESF
jgi:hypothetical protein